MNTENKFGFMGKVLVFFIILFIYSKFGPSLPISVLTQTKGEPFVVSDTGKAVVVPDIAVLTLGVEEQGQSLKNVQNNVNQKSKALTTALKKLDVDEKDIKTINYNVYPEYDYSSSTPKITGYRVSTSYEVKVKDFEKINEVVTIATQNGVNIVGNVSFEINDETKKELTNNAREEAVKLAKEKAERLAKTTGVTLGKIINVSESGEPDYPRPMALYDSKAVGMGGSQPENANITPGETEISVTVTLSYEIR